jgi:phosphatidylserine/phosphatidylglycerophosphate/cardiolipin synthase-like enzyme
MQPPSDPSYFEQDDDPTWQALMNHPRVHVYQLGGLDATAIGGDVAYGKLHAKFIIADDRGFIGTDNFDYRSRLFNNEFGFFYHSAPLSAELNAEFDKLKTKSYLWGSPEWLEARDEALHAILLGDDRSFGSEVTEHYRRMGVPLVSLVGSLSR